MEEKKDHLHRSIEGLQQVKAPDIWTQIEMDLDAEAEQNREVLSKSIDKLPMQKAPDVWLALETELAEQKSRTFSWRTLAVAASFLLVSGLSYLLLAPTSNETIAYSTETVETFEVGFEIPEWDDQGDDMILTYIKENCTRLAVTCQDPEFKALLAAYMELTETKEELSRSMEENAQQAQVMKYLIRVEKNQNEVGKSMLKKLKEI